MFENRKNKPSAMPSRGCEKLLVPEHWGHYSEMAVRSQEQIASG